MQRKISLALGVIAAMLIISGIISVLEYRRMSRVVSELVAADVENISVAQQIAASSERFNLKILDAVTSKDSLTAVRDFNISADIAECESIFLKLSSVRKMRLTDSLMLVFVEYIEESKNCISVIPSALKDSKRWYFDVLQPRYKCLTETIELYNEEVHNDLISKANDFNSGFYRSIMPGLITVVAGLILLLLLLFYIMAYYVSPVRHMCISLENYLKKGVRYNFDFEGDDELKRLNSSILEVSEENVELRKRIKALKNQSSGTQS